MKQRNLIIIAALVIAAVSVAVVLAQGNSSSTTSASTIINPTNYQAQFTSSGSDHLLIDVRTPEEFNSGHIAGAINIPVDEIGGRLSEIPTDQTIVVYCRSGNRSAQASDILENAGYANIFDLGGIIAWQAAGLPVE